MDEKAEEITRPTIMLKMLVQNRSGIGQSAAEGECARGERPKSQYAPKRSRPGRPRWCRRRPQHEQEKMQLGAAYAQAETVEWIEGEVDGEAREDRNISRRSRASRMARAPATVGDTGEVRSPKPPRGRAARAAVPPVVPVQTFFFLVRISRGL